MALADPFKSYLPAERRAAANERLTQARTAVHELTLAWEGRNPKADLDDLAVLRERLQGERGQVAQWLRYIKNGCPRSR